MFIKIEPLTSGAEKALFEAVSTFRTAVKPRIVATGLVARTDIRIDALFNTTASIDTEAVDMGIATKMIAWCATGVTEPEELKILTKILVETWQELGLENIVGHIEVFDIPLNAWATSLPSY